MINANSVVNEITKRIEQQSVHQNFKRRISKDKYEWLKEFSNQLQLEELVEKLLKNKYKVTIITDEECDKRYICVLWESRTAEQVRYSWENFQDSWDEM